MAPSVAELLAERSRRKYRGGAGSWDQLSVEDQLQGFIAFCNDMVKIAHPRGKRPLVLRDPQIETAKAYIADDQVLILKARQIGFTTLTMVFCVWRMLFFEDFSIIVLSRKDDDAKANLAMAALAIRELPLEFQKFLPQRTDSGASRITMSNGSWMESHPAGGGNPARGRTVSLMILDEWAFMPDPDDAWAAVKPVTDIGGRIVALSTANGWGNTFHKMWVSAVAGDNNFQPIFFPWWAVPERDEAWYEQQRRDMQPWQLAQEFPSTPEEAFIKSGNPVFDLDYLKGIVTEDPILGQLVGETPSSRHLIQNEHGFLRIYAMPAVGSSYAIGADVAQGLEHGDYSCAQVIDIKTGLVAAVWHGHIDPDLFGDELAALGWFYNVALVGVEFNNHGMTTNKALLRGGYPNIYYRKRLGNRREVVSEELGFMTTRSTKPFIIDGLGAAMRNGELLCLDEPTRQELMTYVRKPDGSTEGSPHDDRVMALAIAQEMRRHAHEVAAKIVKVGPPADSPQWWLDKFNAEAAASRQPMVLGSGGHNVRGGRLAGR